MATATSPVPDNRSTKRQKGDEAGNSSQGGDNLFPSRPPQHPSQVYPPGYMGMGGGGPAPYMGGAGMPPYGQYGNPHAPPPPPHGSMYGGMYGGGGPPVRGHGSPERPGRPGGPTPVGPGPWNGYRGGPPHNSSSGGAAPGKKDDTGMGNSGPSSQQQQHTQNQHPFPPGGWGHPQSWQPGHPYGPPPGYPGGHPSMSGMYAQGAGGPNGGWGSNGGGGGQPNDPNLGRPTPNSAPTSKSPPRNRPRPESANSDSRQLPPQARNDNLFCLEISSAQGGRMSVTQDFGEEGSSVSGSTKDKGRGSYKCGRCGVPKKGHICPYQPRLKRRPDEPPPEMRNAAVQVEMDEFMTLRRLNIRIQGFPESYATEPFMGASMVGAEPHSHDAYLPPGDPTNSMMPMDDMYNNSRPPPESADIPPMDKDPEEAPMQQANPPPKPENPDRGEVEGDHDDTGDPTEKEEKQAMV